MTLAVIFNLNPYSCTRVVVCFRQLEVTLVASETQFASLDGLNRVFAC